LESGKEEEEEEKASEERREVWSDIVNKQQELIKPNQDRWINQVMLYSVNHVLEIVIVWLLQMPKNPPKIEQNTNRTPSLNPPVTSHLIILR
jgi:hypothetical protein